MAVDQDIVLVVNNLAYFDDAVVIDFVADCFDLVVFSVYFLDVRFVDFGFAVSEGVVLLFGFVGPVGGAPEHAPVDGSLVDNYAVLLVVAHEAAD